MSGLTDTRQDVINTVLYSLYGPSDKLAYSNGHNAEIRDHFNTFGPGITQELYGLPEDDQRIVVAAVIDGMISGLHPGEMRTLLHNLDVYDVVAPDVNKAMDLVRGMAKEDVAIIPESIRPDRKTLATADHIAWRVHGSQIRESGGSYYKHPQAVAAMTLAAFQQLRSEGYQIDDEQISAFLTVCLTHDAAEDTNRSRRYFEGSL
ncbi:MAG: hypothetical protein ACREBW_07415, partial [Candidatus Micrarchaeaceae archaeon]